MRTHTHFVQIVEIKDEPKKEPPKYPLLADRPELLKQLNEWQNNLKRLSHPVDEETTK